MLCSIYTYTHTHTRVCACVRVCMFVVSVYIYDEIVQFETHYLMQADRYNTDYTPTPPLVFLITHNQSCRLVQCNVLDLYSRGTQYKAWPHYWVFWLRGFTVFLSLFRQMLVLVPSYSSCSTFLLKSLSAHFLCPSSHLTEQYIAYEIEEFKNSEIDLNLQNIMWEW